MYKIEKNKKHLRVRLTADFGYNEIRTIMHHVTMLPEYPETDDLWLIGEHRANIRLGELEAMVEDFLRHCPGDASQRRTAVVVEPGFTHAIMELWMKAVRKRAPFDMKMCDTEAEAETWLQTGNSKVA